MAKGSNGSWPAWRKSKNLGLEKMERYRAGMGSNDMHCNVHALSAPTRRKMQKPQVTTRGSCKKKRGKEK